MMITIVFVFERFLAPQSTITQWNRIMTSDQNFKSVVVSVCLGNFRASMLFHFG